MLIDQSELTSTLCGNKLASRRPANNNDRDGCRERESERECVCVCVCQGTPNCQVTR